MVKLTLLVAATVEAVTTSPPLPLPRWTGAPPGAPGIELWRQRPSCSASFPGPPGPPPVPTGDCKGVQTFHSGAPAVTSRFWRWNITASHDGSAPTIHWLEFGESGAQGGKNHWISNTSGWTVQAKAMSNGPVANLLLVGGKGFWNADEPSGCHGPWVATVDAQSAISVDSMRYSIFDAHEAPLAFILEASVSRSGPWRPVIMATAASNTPCYSQRGPAQTTATDSFGIADFFLALSIAVPSPVPALLVFTEARKFSDEDWGAKGIAMRASFGK